MTELTGGRVFPVGNLGELPDIAAKIGMELRNQYVLGYKSSNPRPNGAWRKIKVKLRPPKGLPPLNVFAKTGYYAPNQSPETPYRFSRRIFSHSHRCALFVGRG